MTVLTLQLPPHLQFTDDEFLQIVATNKDLRLELSAEGELILMPPTGGETGDRNLELEGQIWFWKRQTKLGKAFDSSTGFKLPNGAIRSPDVSWIPIEKWNALTPEQRKKFLPIAPDFVIELLSETDDLEDLRAKMREYINNGVRLGWLINPKNQQVEIYRPHQEPEILQSPQTLSGEDVLPGFVLDLEPIFTL
ncbi:MAG TPA: Uma2 family endonuclease [Nostocaceae cyanobacterium]|nr:Uma2 family endonuclease [Nostocaceae cyanobacterium]